MTSTRVEEIYNVDNAVSTKLSVKWESTASLKTFLVLKIAHTKLHFSFSQQYQ